MLNYEFPPLGGGAATVTFHLARELVRRGHSVDVLTMRYPGLPRYQVVDGIGVYRVRCLRRRIEICHTYEMVSFCFAALPIARRLVAQNRYELNHTHFIFPTAFLSWMLKAATGLPYIVTAHGSDVRGFNPDRFRLEHRLFGPLWRAIAHGAKIITSPTESLKSLIVANGCRREVRVIPNGLSLDKFHPRPKEKRVLLVSRLFERKGFQYFLKALDTLESDYEVHIVGEGPYRPALEELAKGLKPKVKFWGWLDNDSEQMKTLYETSAIFVFPSESENFPIVLLEAMAAGAAIITTNVTGCPEVVGPAALYVGQRNAAELRAQFVRLTGDRDLQAQLGRQARERIEALFSWQAVAQQFEDLYASLAGKTAR